MLGAIAGDVIGSTYEFWPAKDAGFELFLPQAMLTDDSLLTLAVAEWLLDGSALVPLFKRAVEQNRGAGWGGMFAQWATGSSVEPYNSFGNGSAMRVSPVGWAFDTLEETLEAAARSAAVTHNHPEGIKGAQAVAAAIFLARHGTSKADIRREITHRFAYDLSRGYEEVRRDATFNETCQVSVPEAIIAFLDSDSFEDAVRKAVWLRADADTQASIAGGIAQAFYAGVPSKIRAKTLERLDGRQIELFRRFEDKFGTGE